MIAQNVSQNRMNPTLEALGISVVSDFLSLDTSVSKTVAFVQQISLEKFKHRNFQIRASDRSNYCSFEMNLSKRDAILGDKHNLLHHQHVGSLSKSTTACTLTLLDNVVGYESLTL